MSHAHAATASNTPHSANTPNADGDERDTEGLWGVYAFWSILGLIFFTSVSLFVFAISQGPSLPIPEMDAAEVSAPQTATTAAPTAP